MLILTKIKLFIFCILFLKARLVVLFGKMAPKIAPISPNRRWRQVFFLGFRPKF